MSLSQQWLENVGLEIFVGSEKKMVEHQLLLIDLLFVIFIKQKLGNIGRKMYYATRD